MLEAFLQNNAFVFMLIFVRVGIAIMVMPGIGDAFVPMRIRALFALSMTLVMMPILQPILPAVMPPMDQLLVLLVSEAVLGFFIGMIARTLVMALDTAGMLISLQSGLSSAQMFNPALQSQGSLIGTFMVLTGVLLLLVTDMHHMMLVGIFNSYQSFPVGEVLDPQSMLDVMGEALTTAFELGVHIAAPFLLIITVMYVCMGILSRIMPQIQVFMLALPLQIFLSLLIFSGVIGFALMLWLNSVQQGIDLYYQTDSAGSSIPVQARGATP
jgi:flagellar biosynthetic protein FliR